MEHMMKMFQLDYLLLVMTGVDKADSPTGYNKSAGNR